MALVGATGVASADADSLPKDAVAALDRLRDTGTLSQEDRQTLLKYPEIAAHVSDPDSRKVEVQTEQAAPSNGTNSIGAAACWINDYYATSYTVLGNIFYRFHQRADHCTSGASVTSVHNEAFRVTGCNVV